MEVDYAYSVYLCGIERADERTRTADLISLRDGEASFAGFFSFV